eukprot:jgi/Orpsp1_1/1192232/evm.model.d7180000091574.1
MKNLTIKSYVKKEMAIILNLVLVFLNVESTMLVSFPPDRKNYFLMLSLLVIKMNALKLKE